MATLTSFRLFRFVSNTVLISGLMFNCSLSYAASDCLLNHVRLLDAEETGALQRYVIGGTVLNQYLRAGGKGDQALDRVVSGLDRLFEKANVLTEDITVFRGETIPKSTYSVGDRIKYPNFVSTTRKQTLAESFAEGGVVFSIRLNKGQRVLFPQQAIGSTGPDVFDIEILLPRNLTFTVISNDKKYIELEIVESSANRLSH